MADAIVAKKGVPLHIARASVINSSGALSETSSSGARRAPPSVSCPRSAALRVTISTGAVCERCGARAATALRRSA